MEDELDVALRILSEELEFADKKLMPRADVPLAHLRKVVGQCRNFRDELTRLKSEIKERERKAAELMYWLLSQSDWSYGEPPTCGAMMQLWESEREKDINVKIVVT